MYKFVEFLCDLLTIDTPKLVIAPNDSYPLPDTAGARSYVKDSVIVINNQFINDDRMYIILSHEVRHIYQYQVVSDNLTELESKSTIREWRRGFKSYRDSSDLHYTDQSLEVDATAFSYYLNLVLFNKEILLPENSRAIIKRAQLISQDLTPSEIRSIYYEYYNQRV